MNRLLGSTALALMLAGTIGRIPAAAAAPAGDAAAGNATVASSCAMCHGVTAGAVMVGPSLYGVAGRKIASVAGYDYSGALKAHGADSWTDAQLDAWLANPTGFAAGTKMYFPGLPDAKSRADVIAYLHTLGPAH